MDQHQDSMLVLHNSEEVQYEDHSHTYSLRGRLYRSSTQIVDQFIRPFDTVERSQYMAERYGRTPEYWVTKWRDGNQVSLDRGTLIHNTKEDYLHSRGVDTIGNKHFRVYNLEKPTDTHLKLNYAKLPDGIYPELKLWNHVWGIAGRVDKPILDTDHLGHRIAHIDDYKTGRKIDQEGWQEKDGSYRMMLDPISHLHDCEWSHYALQLSIYQYMLEGFGFTPGERRIIHYPHPIEGLGTPKPVIYKVPYLYTEVLKMLSHLLLSGWLK